MVDNSFKIKINIDNLNKIDGNANNIKGQYIILVLLFLLKIVFYSFFDKVLSNPTCTNSYKILYNHTSLKLLKMYSK